MLFKFKKEINKKEFNFEIKASVKVGIDSWKYELGKIIINGEEIEKIKIRTIDGEEEKHYGDLNMKKYKGNKVLCIEVTGKTAKKVAKILGIKETGPISFIINEYKDIFEKMEREAEEENKKKQAERQKEIDKEFEDDNKVIKLSNHSYYGLSSYDYNKSTRGKKYIAEVKAEDVKKLLEPKIKQYQTDYDFGDYSITTYYEITIGEFEKIVDEILKIVKVKREEKRIASEKRKKEREKRKNSMEVKILKRGKTGGGEEGPDYFADVAITDKKTGETKKFSCRNIFDFGYVVNPMYSIAKGIEEGGLENKGYWETFNSGEGWVKVRKITEIERRMLDYLYEFNPVGKNIRL